MIAVRVQAGCNQSEDGSLTSRSDSMCSASSVDLDTELETLHDELQHWRQVMLV